MQYGKKLSSWENRRRRRGEQELYIVGVNPQDEGYQLPTPYWTIGKRTSTIKRKKAYGQAEAFERLSKVIAIASLSSPARIYISL